MPPLRYSTVKGIRRRQPAKIARFGAPACQLSTCDVSFYQPRKTTAEPLVSRPSLWPTATRCVPQRSDAQNRNRFNRNALATMTKSDAAMAKAAMMGCNLLRKSGTIAIGASTPAAIGIRATL